MNKKDSYEAFLRHEILWGKYFHYGVFDSTNCFSTAQEHTIDYIADLTSLNSTHRILDAGCGIGSTSIDLAKKFGCIVVGIDPIVRQIEYAKSKLTEIKLPTPPQFEIASVESLPYENNSFDIIVCNEVLCLVTDKEQALSEFQRILRPDGVMLISDLYDTTGGAITMPFHRAMHHVQPMLDTSNYKSLLNLTGFNLTNFIDRKKDFALSYQGAIKRLKENQNDIVNLLGEKDYKSALGFYRYCASEDISTSIGWAMYLCKL